MKVLVSAASRHGASSEIAAAIGEVLVEAGLEVDVLPPDKVVDVAPYDVVIIGSGVYAGHWLGPAKALINRDLERLRSRQVWLFSSGPTGEGLASEVEQPDGDAFHEAIGAVEHRLFPGRLERGRLGFAERVIISVVHAPEGDFRPWPEIRAWAATIAGALRPVGRGLGPSPVAELVR